jgi:hypothetical protein
MAFAKQLGVPVLLANVSQQVYQMARAVGFNKGTAPPSSRCSSGSPACGSAAASKAMRQDLTPTNIATIDAPAVIQAP